MKTRKDLTLAEATVSFVVDTMFLIGLLYCTPAKVIQGTVLWVYTTIDAYIYGAEKALQRTLSVKDMPDSMWTLLYVTAPIVSTLVYIWIYRVWQLL